MKVANRKSGRFSARYAYGLPRMNGPCRIKGGPFR